jgi:hypothetical protein
LLLGVKQCRGEKDDEKKKAKSHGKSRKQKAEGGKRKMGEEGD